MAVAVGYGYEDFLEGAYRHFVALAAGEGVKAFHQEGSGDVADLEGQEDVDSTLNSRFGNDSRYLQIGQGTYESRLSCKVGKYL